jgi:hypothetical protein
MSTVDVLTIWVVYYGARNHPPGKWVVRPQSVERGNIRPHAIFHECNSLLEARAKVPLGLVCMGRDPSDDPTIVEAWL